MESVLFVAMNLSQVIAETTTHRLYNEHNSSERKWETDFKTEASAACADRSADAWMRICNVCLSEILGSGYM